MTVQMLFYEKAVPVSSGRHAGCSVDVSGYAFCRKVNSVPLTAVEFRSVAAEYPIVFAAAGEIVQPVVVLGLRKDENLFVSGDGGWQGRYIPGFVRRYPFVFSTTGEQDKRFVLCVDEAFAGFNRDGRGEALFTAEARPSPYVGKVLRFLQDYRAQFLRTQAFGRRLKDLNLLEPVQVRIDVAGPGAPLSLGGFSTVNRTRLKALPGDKLGELARNDELELLYLHLQSLRNFEALRGRLPAQPATADDLSSLAPATGSEGHRAMLH